MMLVSFFVILALSFVGNDASNDASPTAPNIVFILMDDLGWNDVSFMGSQFPTPNLDAFAEKSVHLTKHYIHLMCSPSRTQIITGRYAMYQGIGKMNPWDANEMGGIPVGQPTVANWLKSLGGYATYAVGKWHMGYAYPALLPGSKGFDHFYGFYQGCIRYDTPKYIDIKFGPTRYYDFWEDGRERSVWDAAETGSIINSMRLYKNKIISHIYDNQRGEDQPFYMYLPLQTMHGPLNSVGEKSEECASILPADTTLERQKYCENMLLTDDIVGDIVNAIHESGVFDNTLIVFTSDNGGDLTNRGCNYPLRGTKGTLFDGNIRTLALVGGGLIPPGQRGTHRDVLFSGLDWTPTLLSFAGVLDSISQSDHTFDGVNQHDLILYGSGADNENKRRNHIVLNIGARDFSSASIVFEKDDILYKYLSENEEIDKWAYKRDDGWCVPDDNNNWDMILDADIALSGDVESRYLFDLTNDVSEKTNLLQLEDHEDLTEYAAKLLAPYIKHRLYGEYLPFLWKRIPAEDPSNFGEGQSIVPFMSETEYFNHVAAGFSDIEDDYNERKQQARKGHTKFTEKMRFTKALKRLYMEKWKPPVYDDVDDVPAAVVSASHSNVFLWYVYVIIAVVVVAAVIVVAVTVLRYRQYQTRFRDGYEVIKKNTEDEVTPLINDAENKKVPV